MDVGASRGRVAVPMKTTLLIDLQQATESQRGGTADARPIRPDQRDLPQSNRMGRYRQSFDLENHPKATRAYAWSSPIEGSEKRRVFAVLHLVGIGSLADAVRAAIVAEQRGSHVH
jgi:hypothetical protein